MGVDDVTHHLLVGEGDVVEHAAAQEGVGQLLLCVGGDDDDGALLRGDGLLGLRDVEFHLIQLPQQVVGELQVGLVDLVDQQDHLLLVRERLAQLAELDILLDIVHAFAAELAVVQTLDGVVHIQAVLGLCRRLDVPNDELLAQGLRNGLGQHGLAGAGLALDQQWLLQRDGDVDDAQQVLGDNVLAASLEFVHSVTILSFLVGFGIWFMT